MTTSPNATKRRKSTLRTAAEAQIVEAPLPQLSVRPTEELLHELQVHEIEIQMQNEELRRSQLALEESRDRYLDLYEFAPIGYLTLSTAGLILEINLTGASLLGQDRAKIIRRPLSRFITPEDSDRFYRLLARVVKYDERQTFAITLQQTGASTLHAQLDCVRVERDGVPVVARVILTDITDRKLAEAEAENLAFYDPLTQLPNRRLLLDRLRQAIAATSRTRKFGAILFIDLDDFKTLNDTQGHDVGDVLLIRVGLRLTACVRVSDTVARFGGDEFVAMLQNLSETRSEAAAQAKAVAEKILTALKQDHKIADHEYRGSASIGICLFSENRESMEELLKRADLALYRAKASGRGVLKFFDPDMQASATARAVLENDLRRALDEQQFVLHYQAQVDDKGVPCGAEALVRWQHPLHGLLYPGDFIPFAEEKGLIEPLGQWVLETACLQLLAWSTAPETAHLTLAINVSAHEFCRPEFVVRTLSIIDGIGADPGRLVLELTERVMLEDTEDTIAKMNLLKARGLRFALDDFGIGYSSLTYLKHLPLDQLKIDRSFVRDVLSKPIDAAIARIMIDLGQSLGLLITVEGVEIEEQREFFLKQGCHSFQGYLVGRPGPVETLFRGTEVSGAPLGIS